MRKPFSEAFQRVFGEDAFYSKKEFKANLIVETGGFSTRGYVYKRKNGLRDILGTYHIVSVRDKATKVWMTEMTYKTYWRTRESVITLRKVR